MRGDRRRRQNISFSRRNALQQGYQKNQKTQNIKQPPKPPCVVDFVLVLVLAFVQVMPLYPLKDGGISNGTLSDF
ncbi:hypothetical protein BOTNAR_0127g00100 [Botryotinia narcissicola]|uniref:Uncharacterized protein n=1 Tax=Botryotinia narcissicola TaxID=278944 RepID=A0A4Z1IXI7_9HELO|nr:hypothetical protein BOTNAR_0127g00100 [Botryotinia narcissicola]